MPTRIHLAGPAAIEHDDRRVDHRRAGSQVWTALAVLVLARERIVGREELADALWSGDPPASWESAVRNVASRTRELLAAAGLPAAEVLVGTPTGYVLQLPAGALVDVAEAEALVLEAADHLAAGRPLPAAAAAAAAGAVFGETFLPGAGGDWVEQVRTRLLGERVQAAELEAQADLAAGDLGAARSAAEVAVALAPFRESAHRLLMQVHAAAGNRAEALRAYSRCRRVLAEELGVDPSPETEAAYVALLGEEPAPRPIRAVRAEPGGGLFGREHDLERVVAALADGRLVTVGGPAGVGKSSVARAAADLQPVASSPRTWWIALSPVGPDALVHTLASAMGSSRSGLDALATIAAELGAEPALLVLDTCEHLVDRVRDVAGTLLATCPSLRILATSRVPLGIAGEVLVTLAPLTPPAAGGPLEDVRANAAVALFAERAAAASVDFRLSDNNLEAVAEICRRLDGLPLALELAAARVRSMPPGEVAGYLEDRFRLLRRPPDEGQGRHRSLEEAIRWSYELLSKPERTTFDRLAVFAGSFNLEAAVAVTGADPLDALEEVESLVAQSMVVPVDDASEARYRLLDTVRAFGRGNLTRRGGGRRTEERHRAHHVQVASIAGAGVRGPDEARWVRRLQRDFPDIRLAFRSSVDAGDLDVALAMVADLFEFGFFRMEHEVGAWAAEVVAIPGAAERPRFAEAAGVAGYLAWQRGDLDGASAHLAQADAAGGGWIAEDAAATLALFRGDIEVALAGYERAQATATAAGDVDRAAIAASQIAFARVLAGRDDAFVAAVEAQRLADLTGNPTAIAQSAWGTGIALYDGDPAAALEELDQATALGLTVDNRLTVGSAAVPAEELRAKLAQKTPEGDLEATLERLEYWLRAGSPPIVWSTVRRMARLLAGVGAYEAAALALGAEAGAALKVPIREREGQRHVVVEELVRGALGEGDFAAIAARGAALEPSVLVAELRAAMRP